MRLLKKTASRIRARLGKAVSLEGVSDGVITWDELRKVSTGHLVCKKCLSPWFEVWRETEGIRIGCGKCGGWNALLMISVPTDDLEKVGRIRCGCGFGGDSALYAVMKDGNFVCIGCKKCPEQVLIKVPEKTTDSGLILLN